MGKKLWNLTVVGPADAQKVVKIDHLRPRSPAEGQKVAILTTPSPSDSQNVVISGSACPADGLKLTKLANLWLQEAGGRPKNVKIDHFVPPDGRQTG